MSKRKRKPAKPKTAEQLERARTYARERARRLRREDPEKERARVREVNRRAKEKRRVWAAEWRKKNPDKVREANRKNRAYQTQWKAEWRKKNPDKEREILQRYREKNAEVCKARQRAKYQKNKAKVAEKGAERYEREKVKILATQKAWREKNRGVRKALEHKRRAKKRGNGGAHTFADVDWLLTAQGGLCAGCRIDITEKYTVDHIIPLCRGGTDNADNLQLMCKTCNCSKKDKTMDEWLFVLPRTRLCRWPRK